MADKIKVGCKFPHGIKLPAVEKMPEGFVPPTLNGAYTHPSFQPHIGKLESIAFGTTLVDADYWQAFVEEYADWPPLKKGFIWAAEKPADFKEKAKEAGEIKTVLAGADPNAKGSGVEKAVIK